MHTTTSGTHAVRVEAFSEGYKFLTPSWYAGCTSYHLETDMTDLQNLGWTTELHGHPPKSSLWTPTTCQILKGQQLLVLDRQKSVLVKSKGPPERAS